jgi:tetratricopeptide (TPR) repeat protein
MLRPKHKITKKELKEDALISTYAKSVAWYEEHKRLLAIGAGAVAVVVLLAVVYTNNRRANNEKAIAELGKVYEFVDNGQYQTALDGVPERNIPGLKAIVENYGGTEGGEMARFYMANAVYQLGNFAEALEAFEDFDAPDPVLSVSRLAGIAACHEALGDHAEAASYFEKAAGVTPRDVTAADNLHFAAQNYGQAGKRERALELYRKIKKEYPRSTVARDADRYIAQFSM